MYAHDHDDEAPPNDVENGYPWKTWVQGWLDLRNGSNNTNTAYLLASHLWPYYQSLSVWRCPADKSASTHGAQRLPRARSYSMNAFMNLNCDPLPYRVIRKTTDRVDPPPSRTMVFTDERAESIDDGVFSVDMTEERILDWPGVFHGSVSALFFADGPTELKTWLDPRTMPKVHSGQPWPTGGPPSPNKSDVRWLQERTTGKTK